MSKTRHIFFLNQLDDLTIEKDSTLAIMAALKDRDLAVYILFEEDFYYENNSDVTFKVSNFNHAWDQDGLIITSFEITTSERLTLGQFDNVYLRLDPPFDLKYLRYTWMWDSLEQLIGFKTENKASELLKNNEKLIAYNTKDACNTLITSSFSIFQSYILNNNLKEIVCKPIDLYQGIGVKKLSTNDQNLKSIFEQLIEDYNGPIVVQPFLENVIKGEIRIVYFDQQFIGAIKKIPAKGHFISNIASGATFVDYKPSNEELGICASLSTRLFETGLNFLAFDILDNQVQEINITCPGLIVELTKASKVNKASAIADLIIGD